MSLISIEEIGHTTRLALLAHGATEGVARIMEDAVTWAEARGNWICGLYYVESYCQQLHSGRVLGDAVPVVEQPRAGVVTVDAANGFAQPAFAAALPRAISTARATGIASVAISHAHTCTALGWFTEAAAREGLIALGMTNASPIVAPPGGSRRVLGTNPIALAVPDGSGGIALSYDQATTQVALGRITMANAAGETIPEGWALDADGQPTTDPAQALKGSLASAGGHKGWNIALMVELLVAGMTGMRISSEVAPLKAPVGDPHGLGQYFILIDPSVSAAFAERVAAIRTEVEADGGGRLPGVSRTLATEVEVPSALWETISGLAQVT